MSLSALKLVSFNLRCDTSSHDGPNHFNLRRDLIVDQILNERPTAIAFQEMTPTMLEYLRPALPGYAFFGHSRDADYYSDESNPIALDLQRLDLLKLDTFWLSDTPRIPGSRFHKQSICPRILTCMRLRDLQNHRCFLLFNTHLDHEFEEARLGGIRVIMNTIRAWQELYPSEPFLLMGDFNASPDSAEYALLSAEFSDLSHGIKTSFHGFEQLNVPIKIDYIWADPGFAERESCQIQIWHKRKGRCLSDHDALLMDWED